jgi:voltage-gated potassium channel Kch
MNDVETGQQETRTGQTPGTERVVAAGRSYTRRATAIGAVGFSALALGATAIDALAFGRLAVGALAVQLADARRRTTFMTPSRARPACADQVARSRHQAARTS